MISKIEVNVTADLISQIKSEVLALQLDGKTIINQPTGDFFYDKWEIQEKYRDTAIAYALNQLPENIGEARIIKLAGGTTYAKHSDIDDRYHLNITGIESFLIDLNEQKMHQIFPDGHWYTMDTGLPHVAANFGNRDRFQLVVRHLLIRPVLDNPVNVTLQTLIDDLDEARYIFDNTLSPWLNRANKKSIINNFKKTARGITVTVEKGALSELLGIVPIKIFEVLY